MYRAMISKDTDQKPPSRPPRPTMQQRQQQDPADSSPFRFPPEVFGANDLPRGRATGRNTQETRRRAYSAGASIR